jgi:transglutaminase-like putative cysteine protease
MVVHAGVTDSNVTYGPPDDWVKPHFFNQRASSSLVDSSDDEHVLLLEQQVNALENETFFHTDRQILTLDGVQNGSTIKIHFNPKYQSVLFHWARVWRDGQHFERLDTNKVQVLQQEQSLEQDAIMNGEKSIVLVLDDVRAGDVIDYAYSVKGKNPVFDWHFSSIVPVAMEGVSAEHVLTRVLWPRDKRLYAKAHGCSVAPALVQGDGYLEYDWEFRQVPGITPEDSLPDWYDPEEWIQLSDFQSWAEVNQWALSLFQVTAPFSPELSQQIAGWRQIPGQEQKVLAVLRFVQDNVRYFGIEIGVSSEKPADPSVVFSRRFGDCKDKSLLFVTILRALGIEAYPVLVNSTLGHALDDWAPSAGAFDHCIAEVRCDGEIYFVDPTMNYQRGPLSAHYLPNYERGLVISPRTTALAVIPQTTGLPQTTTTEYFQIRGNQFESDLSVVTVAQGRDAEKLRAMFATTKLSDIEENYTHFYSSFYPGVKMSSPIVVDDDEDQNTFQTTEYYSINNAWTKSDSGDSYSVEFYPSSIKALLKKPVSTDRNQPLGIAYPAHQILRTEVTLPFQWSYAASDKTISGPSFTFRKSAKCVGNKVITQYEYQSLADSVSPDDVSDYIDQLGQCSKILGYSVVWR